MNKRLTYKVVQNSLQVLANPSRATASQRFFKTGKGQYGEGDVFLGITVPQQRNVAKQHSALPLVDITTLLKSPVHEHRFTGLEILVMQYEKGDEQTKKEIVKCYLKNTHRINNWDLVDTSAPYILGQYLLNKDRKILYALAKSKNIWERRIAIVTTLAFIAQDDFRDTVALAKLLLKDQHDLIHKACGWMLREVGKRDKQALKRFLDEHAQVMPRTMLRYSIEHFPERMRKRYLLKK